MQMLLNRDYVHVHASGVSVGFKKNVPTFVPPRLVPDIVALGGEVAGEDTAVVEAIKSKMAEDKVEQEARGPRIAEAIKTMIERNQRGDFTGQGKPNLRILMNLTNLEITPEELGPIWDKIKAELN